MPLLLSPMRRIIFLLIAVAATLPPAVATDACIADWSDAASIVHQNKLTTVEALSRLAATELPGAIVKTTLCEEKGSFVYRLVVRDPQGKLTAHTVDARAPFGR
jgi:uncharacterized membrane protein YkoI